MHDSSKHVDKTGISTPEEVEYKYVTCHSIITHISAVESMASQLRDMDVSIDDTDIITKILITLPTSYRHFMSAWDNVPDDKKTVELLTTRLLKEEVINSTYGLPKASN